MVSKKRAAAPPPTGERRPTRARTDSTPQNEPVNLAQHLECSICMSLFHEPYLLAASGQTYDLECLLELVASGNTTCPMSRIDFKNNAHAFPNIAIRSLVAEYIQKNPGAGELRSRQPSQSIHLLDPGTQRRFKHYSLVKQLRNAVEEDQQVKALEKIYAITCDDHAARFISLEIPYSLFSVAQFLRSPSADCRYNAIGILGNVAKQDKFGIWIANTPDTLSNLEALLAPSEPDYVRAEAASFIGRFLVFS